MKTTKSYFLTLKTFLKHFISFNLLLFIAFSLINFSCTKNTNASWLEKVSTDKLDVIGDTAYGQKKDNPSQIIIVVASIINVCLGLLGIIFLILILYAGFNYMTAGGEEDKITKAKETITRAFIGLIIILMSWAIAKFIVNTLIKAAK